jgi:hypothetical protein
MGGVCTHVQQFSFVFRSYETLVANYPDVPEYRMHYAQVLYHAGQFESAEAVVMTIERPEDEVQVCQLNMFEIIIIVQLQCSFIHEFNRSRSCKLPSSSRTMILLPVV